MKICTLDELCVGERAIVNSLDVKGAMRRRLLDIGLCRGAWVECVSRSPLGDPAAYLVRGAVIAIRAADCRGVTVRGI